mmetsp:Transcript_30432/g.72540  ORF Transcript_30432/g.72540 Transcript_30432/m.72540 type:complete len:213 (-) Transcript_30432:752-1390(-)
MNGVAIRSLVDRPSPETGIASTSAAGKMRTVLAELANVSSTSCELTCGVGILSRLDRSCSLLLSASNSSMLDSTGARITLRSSPEPGATYGVAIRSRTERFPTSGTVSGTSGDVTVVTESENCTDASDSDSPPAWEAQGVGTRSREERSVELGPSGDSVTLGGSAESLAKGLRLLEAASAPSEVGPSPSAENCRSSCSSSSKRLLIITHSSS